MAKSSIERTIEKQIQEQKRFAAQQKRQAEQQARDEKHRARETSLDAQAQSVVSNARTINGFTVMDGESEEFLQIALAKLEKTVRAGKSEKSEIQITLEETPEHLQRSFDLLIKKLGYYGVISGAVNYTYFVRFSISPEGRTYFAEKKKMMTLPQVSTMQRQNFDVFISHATKDKEDYVEELYMALRKLGIKIFYDTDSIAWGDNLKETILNGTAQSEFAIIVISKNFFSREWTELELKEFLSQQNESGQKKILPLLHGVSVAELKEHYPELGEVLAISSADNSKQDIAILLAKELIKRYR